MKNFVKLTGLLLVLLFACTGTHQESGIERASFDTSIRPQDDIYHYVNGTWLKNTEIPADKSNYGAFTALFDENQIKLRKIIEEAAQGQHEADSEAQKVGDFYLSYMDTVLIEELGLKPLESEIAQVSSIQTPTDLIKRLAYFSKIGVQVPFNFYINQDEKNSTQYIAYFYQSGLGLPDRDYYLKEDEKFKTIRNKYTAYIERLLTMAQQVKAASAATRILEIETTLAKNHWTRVQNRDRDKTYNKYGISQLKELMPNFDWATYLAATGLNVSNAVILRQPDYFKALDQIFGNVSIEAWKEYLHWKLLNTFSPQLNQEFVEASFDFYGRTIQGIEQLEPRWKRAVNATNTVVGELVGKVYVARYFKPEAKTRMLELVANLKTAFEERIKALDWMGAETKEKALVKLAKFVAKIGYPDKWKDYSALEIKKHELITNYMRANQEEYNRQISKLGQPIDRDEWFMTPQTVNAYYNPPMNEVVFPAAILQPPFFNMNADDAVNYGAIGAVIGHEMSHGFDDQGRKSDGDGNLVDWWTEADEKEFNKRGKILIEQFSQYSPIDSMFVNGELTLGENIGDLGGVFVAYHAYKNSLKGKEAPVIDGLTGDQRFFIGWVQVWRRKYREEELRRRLLIDPHSPSEYRANGPLAHVPAFYAAFDVKEGDKMYRPEEMRVQIW